ncbi:MAG: NAD(P)-dependent oxidoreductase, partial [Syntrophaceae bacterium]
LKPFDVNLIGIKRQDPEQAKKELGLQWAGTPFQMDDLLGRSDYVVLCLPLTVESKNMIGKREFEKMKNDAYLINLARGGLVDRDALLDALSCNRIAGAGLDVFWEEPPDPHDPVFNYNVLATPHIAWATDSSTKGISEGVSENIRRLEAGEDILYVKN